MNDDKLNFRKQRKCLLQTSKQEIKEKITHETYLINCDCDCDA